MIYQRKYHRLVNVYLCNMLVMLNNEYQRKTSSTRAKSTAVTITLRVLLTLEQLSFEHRLNTHWTLRYKSDKTVQDSGTVEPTNTV